MPKAQDKPFKQIKPFKMILIQMHTSGRCETDGTVISISGVSSTLGKIVVLSPAVVEVSFYQCENIHVYYYFIFTTKPKINLKILHLHRCTNRN